MEHPHVSETRVPDGDAHRLAEANGLKLDHAQIRAENTLRRFGSNAASESALPNIWVARMLRAGGGAVMLASSPSLFRDIFIHGNAQMPWLLADAGAFGLGVTLFVGSSWLSPRPWRSFLFVSYCLLAF